MRIQILCTSLFLATTISAQLSTFQLDWKKVVQPFGNANTESCCIAEIPGTGFVWAGYKDNFNATDIWIQKIDYQGHILWETTFGGDHYDNPTQIRAFDDGSFIVVGYSQSTNISNSWADQDVILLKYSHDGHLEWWKRYGSVNPDGATDVRICQDGGFIVTGSIDKEEQNGIIYFDAWIFKTDPYGNVIWDRTYGGSQTDVAQSVVQTPDQGFVIAVASWSADGDFDVHTSEIDPWLIKLDANGMIEWKKHYGGTESEVWSHIELAPDGGFLLSGSIEHGSDLTPNHYGFGDAWVCRVSAQGDLLWSKNFGGSKGDGIFSMSPGAAGWYWLAGFTMSDDYDICLNRGDTDYWVFAVDLDGNLVWSQTFGGSGYDEGLGISGISDGFIVCGRANSKDGDVGPLEPYQSGWLLKIKNPQRFCIDFPTDTAFCGFEGARLQLPLPDSISAHWNTGHQGNRLDLTTSGLYTASASLFGCESTDSIMVTVLAQPLLPTDTVLCFRDSLLLATDISTDKILWSTGSETKTIWANKAGTYVAEMYLGDCVFLDSVIIVEEWCDEEDFCFRIPSAFTPDGDGYNDSFGPLNICDISPDYIDFSIFNRWGQQVFSYNGTFWPRWDGIDAPSDVYIWRLSLSISLNGSNINVQKHGDVTLLR